MNAPVLVPVVVSGGTLAYDDGATMLPPTMGGADGAIMDGGGATTVVA